MTIHSRFLGLDGVSLGTLGQPAEKGFRFQKTDIEGPQDTGVPQLTARTKDAHHVCTEP